MSEKSSPPAISAQIQKAYDEAKVSYDAVKIKLQQIYPKQSFVPFPDLKLTTERSERGEHVINNDVTKVIRKIIDDVVKEVYGVRYSTLEKLVARCRDLGDATLSDTTLYKVYKDPTVIEDLVVDIPPTEDYANFNAAHYALCIRPVKIEAQAFLVMQYRRFAVNRAGAPDPPANYVYECRCRLEHCIAQLHESLAYVDALARDKWIGKDKGRRRLYEEVKNKVAEMFNQLINWDELTNWMTDLHDKTYKYRDNLYSE